MQRSLKRLVALALIALAMVGGVTAAHVATSHSVLASDPGSSGGNGG